MNRARSFNAVPLKRHLMNNAAQTKSRQWKDNFFNVHQGKSIKVDTDERRIVMLEVGGKAVCLPQEGDKRRLIHKRDKGQRVISTCI
jgi:beta-lactamase superfamily II metal-dependent hydrolase